MASDQTTTAPTGRDAEIAAERFAEILAACATICAQCDRLLTLLPGEANFVNAMIGQTRRLTRVAAEALHDADPAGFLAELDRARAFYDHDHGAPALDLLDAVEDKLAGRPPRPP
jgi:hypothetical protein